MKINQIKTLYGIMAVKAEATVHYIDRDVVGSIAPRVESYVEYEFKVMESLNYSRGDFHANVREADRLQKEFDADCDPVRVYVYEQQSRDGVPIPVYAAFAQRRPSFGMEYELFRQGANPEFERMFP